MRQHEYQGHQINTYAKQVGKKWAGSYQVDGGEIKNVGDRAVMPDEDAAHAEALSAAKQALPK